MIRMEGERMIRMEEEGGKEGRSKCDRGGRKLKGR